MYCTQCGSEVMDGAQYCSNCGSQTEQTDHSQQTAPLPEQYAQEQPMYPVYPQEKRHSNNILTSVIVSTLLIGFVVFMLINFKVINIKPLKPAKMTSVDTTPAAVLSTKPSTTPKLTAKPTRNPTNSPIATAVPVTSSKLTKEEMLDYFLELAVTKQDEILLRWKEPIKVEINGDYTEVDYDRIVGQLDQFNDMGAFPPITVVEKDGNFLIHFVPKKQMVKVLENWEDGYLSYYNYYYDDDYQLSKYVTAIASDETSQTERNYLCLEMMTRGLGIFNASSDDPDSIFQKDWTNIQTLSDLDYKVINMLYNSSIKPGPLQPNTKDLLLKWLDNGW